MLVVFLLLLVCLLVSIVHQYCSWQAKGCLSLLPDVPQQLLHRHMLCCWLLRWLSEGAVSLCLLVCCSWRLGTTCSSEASNNECRQWLQLKCTAVMHDGPEDRLQVGGRCFA